MSTFKGFKNKDGLVVVMETAAGREVIVPPHERPTKKGKKVFPRGWGDSFDEPDEVYQVGFDILCTVYHSERVAAIFCKSFAEEFLMDCGTTFCITRQEIVNWLEEKQRGVAA